MLIRHKRKWTSPSEQIQSKRRCLLSRTGSIVVIVIIRRWIIDLIITTTVVVAVVVSEETPPGAHEHVAALPRHLLRVALGAAVGVLGRAGPLLRPRKLNDRCAHHSATRIRCCRSSSIIVNIVIIIAGR